nr:MAG: DNA pilot protein [Microvirus sp.]
MPIGLGAASLIGGAVSSGTGIINSLLQNRMAKRNTDETIAANMNLAKYQYSQELENWNRQNEYNSPNSQMKRFTEAGLNPNLIYGQGNSGNATVMPRYNAPTIKKDYQPFQLPEMIGFFQNFAMKQAQTDNLRAQKDLIQLQSDLTYNRSNNLSWINSDLARKFLMNWGYEGPQNTKPLSIESSNFFKKWQQDFAGEKQRQDINQFQLDLFRNGGKYFTPLLQLLSLMKR